MSVSTFYSCHLSESLVNFLHALRDSASVRELNWSMTPMSWRVDKNIVNGGHYHLATLYVFFVGSWWATPRSNVGVKPHLGVHHPGIVMWFTFPQTTHKQPTNTPWFTHLSENISLYRDAYDVYIYIHYIIIYLPIYIYLYLYLYYILYIYIHVI